ncbi:MAG: methylated-DNA--[protein]-cysteine S-methyltransferase [Isosphaeraceae bacterium]|nr:methylated-DNA--[protein]-cysteine S-methyltransferase [Isosphaeraceae bacterium]
MASILKTRVFPGAADAVARSESSSDLAESIAVQTIESPVGPLTAGIAGDAVCLLEYRRACLADQIGSLERQLRRECVTRRVPLHDRLERELDDYFQGRSTRFGLPLLYPGTPFQERVWSALLRIPYGSTWSYERLAVEIGNPDAQRAVGTANGRNRISILIPCHRVINKSGALGGYGGGLERKQMLLELEARTVRSAADLLPPP